MSVAYRVCEVPPRVAVAWSLAESASTGSVELIIVRRVRFRGLGRGEVT
ncbi:hypothetical protein [Lentzea tibetensis]|nr:hypothetical protein [Lentzea tibetensis]